MIGLFCLLLVNLFLLRFKAGDIYPPYSSLRSDPLGSKALVASLERLDSVTVERNFSSIDQLDAPADTSLFFLGIRSGKTHIIPQKEYEQIEALVRSGCRLVVALTPADLSSFDSDCPDPETDSTESADTKPADPETDTSEKDNPEIDAPQRVDLYKKWGIEVRYHKTEKGPLSAEPAPDELYQSVSWPLALWFTPDPEHWETVYEVDGRPGKPIIIEREFGKGRVILLADSYIFSNESLKKDNNSQLLAWLAQGRHRVIFDEFHFGVQQHSGISTLVKKYNLYGPLVFFTILVLLIIWKRASGLVPPDEQKELAAMMDTHQGSGQKLLSGLTSLLKQHIPKSRLINECKTAWKEAFVKDNKASEVYAGLFEKIEADSPKKINPMGKPVDDYIRICRILSKGKNQ